MATTNTLASRITRAIFLCLVVVSLSLTLAPKAEAFPSICNSFTDGHAGSSLWDAIGECDNATPNVMCTICHNTNNGGNVNPPDFNSFGSLVNANGQNPTAAAVLSEDTDGDGWTNGQERTRGTFPDNASSKPGPPIVADKMVNYNGGDTAVAISVPNTGNQDLVVVTVTNQPLGNNVAVETPPHGANIEFTWDSTGNMPPAATTSFTFRASNPDNNTLNASTATVTLNLNAAATDDPADVDALGMVDIDVLGNDVGAGGIDITTPGPGCNGDAPALGSIQLIAGPQIRYTHTSGTSPSASEASVQDTFSYCATGTGNPAVATVTVTISTVAPTSAADTPSVAAGDSVDFDVTANDTTGGTPLTVTIETLPSNGTLTVNGTDVIDTDLPLLINPIVDITYTPNPGFLGPTDTFNYHTSNGGGDSDSTAVTIDITFTAVLGNNAIENSVIDPALLPVAKSLDSVCVDLDTEGLANLTDDQSDLFSNCVVLSTIATNGGSVEEALRSINNEDAFAASSIGLRLGQTSLNNVSDRLNRIRGGGGGGFDANGLKIGFTNVQVPFQIASLIQNTTELYFPRDEYEPLPWGVFINGGFSLGDQSATSNQPGFDFDSRGVTFGGDYRFSEKFILGAAFTFSNTQADQNNNAGEIGINGRSATIYGVVSPKKNMYFEWQAGYGVQYYESKRNISFAAGGFLVDRQAIASYDGYQVSALGAFVYDLHRGNLTFSPIIELSYLHGTVDPYSESRAGGLSLMVSEQTYETFFASVGARASYSFETSFGLIVPRVMFEVNHEFLDDVRTISQNFVSAPTGSSAFTIRSDDSVDRNFFTVGGGIDAHFGEQVTGFIDYSTLQGLENTSNHSFSAGIRVRF